jgi:large repetitive protein
MGHIKRRRNNLGLMALEPRWMFDGAAAVDAAHAAADASAKALIPDAPAPVEVRAADPSKDGGKKEVVFIDTSVADYKTLEAAVKPGVEIEEIDGGRSGLAQMAKWAETHTGYDSITILSHGAEGAVKIGSDILPMPSYPMPRPRPNWPRSAMPSMPVAIFCSMAAKSPRAMTGSAS